MAKIAAVPPPDKIFAGKVFVLQGDFGRYPRTHLNIARLIARHGGRVDTMVTDKTTLLVTTIEEFRKRTPASKCALIFISFSLLSQKQPLLTVISGCSREGNLVGQGEMPNCSVGIHWRLHLYKKWKAKGHLGELSRNPVRSQEAESSQRGQGYLQEKIHTWCECNKGTGRSG